MHGYLCFDGYGFKRAFFDYPKDPEALDGLYSFDGYTRNATFHGVGRAFFFLYMARPELLVEHLNNLGRHAEDAVAGVGLAAVFVNPDRFEAAQTFAATIPRHWRKHFHLGMCFGLKARSINDVNQFERDMARLDHDTQNAVFASVRECDRVELQVRADGSDQGYRRWRERVTAWMVENITYPMAALAKPIRNVERPLDIARA